MATMESHLGHAEKMVFPTDRVVDQVVPASFCEWTIMFFACPGRLSIYLSCFSDLNFKVRTV